jgi:hypothetical protein
VIAAVAVGCSKAPAEPPKPADQPHAGSGSGSGASSYRDLPAALAAILPSDARVIGFGELHARTDREQVRSALDHFTHEALPGLADRTSDLVIETWVQDQRCGSAAAEASTHIETTMKRPVETKSEIAELANAARAKNIQPHAMTITCDDYAVVAPPGKEVDAVAMLALTTRELARLAVGSVKLRDKQSEPRPWVLLYGGALHNDRFPEPGTEEWSYAAAVDKETGNKFVEVDLIVPELATGDAASMRQPWYPLVEHADTAVHVWRRGERSFVVVLPRTR